MRLSPSASVAVMGRPTFWFAAVFSTRLRSSFAGSNRGRLLPPSLSFQFDGYSGAGAGLESGWQVFELDSDLLAVVVIGVVDRRDGERAYRVPVLEYQSPGYSRVVGAGRPTAVLNPQWDRDVCWHA